MQCCLCCRDFNPRSHEGSDDSFQLGINVPCQISIHAPTKGATKQVGHDRKFCRISIHAPTKGATKQVGHDRKFCRISIHAPTKGATRSTTSLKLKTMNFNPRSHEGSDQVSFSPLPLNLYFNPRSHEGSDSPRVMPVPPVSAISIHAPTKGATGCG